MHILVTGGTGTVGRAAVTRLVEHGHHVRVIGRRSGLTIPGAEYVSCDIADFTGVSQQMAGIEGVVHLAAIIHPSHASGQEIFRVNCSGTYNVYRAAADAGIKRIISASSINALGYNFGIKDFPLRYLPIDEHHPTFTTDPYSFSKQIIEEIAAYFWRREGISGLCLRLPAVYEVAPGPWGVLRQFVARSRADHQAFMQLSAPQRQERAQEITERFEQLRGERTWEQPLRNLGIDMPDAPIMFGRSNFWTSIDSRDSAQAIEKGLLADYEGSHPVFVNDDQNYTGIESEVLARLFFPEIAARKHTLAGTESVVSIGRAQELTGFIPEYSVDDW